MTAAPNPVVFTSIAVVLTAAICLTAAWLEALRKTDPGKRHDAVETPGEEEICETCGRQRSARVSKKILRMTRNAERLHRVETDLIRKVCESETADAPTARLLAELQICSNRMRAQLLDLDESAEPDSTPSLPVLSAGDN